MLCVIPVSSHDASLIPSFSKAVRHCGANALHQALVVVRPSDSASGQELVKSLDGLFESIELFVLPSDGPAGWPKGPNFYWASTITHLMAVGNQQPWLWCELDCTPLKSGWLDALATEYNLVSSSKPFMGVIETTHATNAAGEPVDAGKHLVGVAVYPASISRISQIWPYVINMTTPFDVITQWEVVPKSHDTKLMQHCFRTENYEHTPEGVRGDDNNGFPNGIRFNHILSPDAVLHHGCIDGSLSDLITASADRGAASKSEVNDDILCPPRRKVKMP